MEKYTNNWQKMMKKHRFFHHFSVSFFIIFISIFILSLFHSASVSTSFLADGSPSSLFGNGKTDAVFSGDGLEGGAQIVQDNIQGTGLIEEGSIIETIIFIIKYILIFSGILALFAFIWAGFLYITAFIDEGNTETAKKTMTFAAIGLLLILFSWIIVDFLTTFDLGGL